MINKQELLENYTMEQLADMVIKYQEMARQITLDENVSNKQMFKNKSAVAYEAELSEYRMKIDALKNELDRKETIISQIDDILNELFGITHDVTNKPDEFKEILKEKIENSKTISDFLPAEPIEAATELINATYTRNKGELEKKIDKAFGNISDITIEQMYSVSELRQIAEHLLIYCNANGEGKE